MNAQKIENLYGKIGNTLNQMISEDWSKVFMRAEIWSENNEGKEVSCTGAYYYYYSLEKNEYIYGYDEEDLFSTDDFQCLMDSLYKTCGELWMEFVAQEQEPWSNFTFILTSEGKMKIDFAYDDLYELYDKFMSDEIREQWEEKYLK